MSAHDEDRIKNLLQRALPPIEPEPTAGLEPNTGPEQSASLEPSIDLWPQVLRRLDADPAATDPDLLRKNWFDWALLAGLVVFAISFPATIPVFLYYF